MLVELGDGSAATSTTRLNRSSKSMLGEAGAGRGQRSWPIGSVHYSILKATQHRLESTDVQKRMGRRVSTWVHGHISYSPERDWEYYNVLDKHCEDLKKVTGGGVGWFAHIYSDDQEPGYGIYNSAGALKFPFHPRTHC